MWCRFERSIWTLGQSYFLHKKADGLLENYEDRNEIVKNILGS